MSGITNYLSDLIRLEQGKMTKRDIREKWKAGKYQGVSGEYAAWAMKRQNG